MTPAVFLNHPLSAAWVRRSSYSRDRLCIEPTPGLHPECHSLLTSVPSKSFGISLTSILIHWYCHRNTRHGYILSLSGRFWLYSIFLYPRNQQRKVEHPPHTEEWEDLSRSARKLLPPGIEC